MDRLALVYGLRPGAKDTYIQAHREIWPEMMEAVDPVSQRWEAWMATLLEQPYDEDEPDIFARLEQA